MSSPSTTLAGAAGEAPEQIPFRLGLFEIDAATRAPVLLASRCATCGSAFFPRRSTCPKCHGRGQVQDVRLNGRGTIYASTVVRVPSPVGIKPPYAYGYVDLDEARVRVFALFTGADPAVFKPGLVVELVVESLRKDAQGRDVIAYKFTPAEVAKVP